MTKSAQTIANIIYHKFMNSIKINLNFFFIKRFVDQKKNPSFIKINYL